MTKLIDMELSIVVVTFNNQDNIDATISSLVKRRPPQSEIVVVDNASTDRTVELLQKFSEIKLLTLPDNRGFSKGCNYGAKNSTGRYLLFLNPDCQVGNEALIRLLEEIKADQSIGILAPALVLTDGTIQRSVTNLPTIWGAIREYWLGVKNAYRQYAPKSGEPIEVEAVYGAAMLMKRSVFDKLKGFDERYFLYREDLDLCRRVRALGLKVVYDPTVQLDHAHGLSTAQMLSSRLPKGVRILANFWPIKKSGPAYYQIVSGNIYHGWLVATLIRLVIYSGSKLL